MELPKIPSQLLRIALEDMKATIAQGIEINMNSWGIGTLENEALCSVCFAGSVMLQRTKKGQDPILFEVDGENFEQYRFLDEIRKGNLKSAMDMLDVEVGDNPLLGWAEDISPNWFTYDEGGEKFLNQIKELADQLEKMGH